MAIGGDAPFLTCVLKIERDGMAGAQEQDATGGRAASEAWKSRGRLARS